MRSSKFCSAHRLAYFPIVSSIFGGIGLTQYMNPYDLRIFKDK